jgi:hypothetical protein
MTPHEPGIKPEKLKSFAIINKTASGYSCSTVFNAFNFQQMSAMSILAQHSLAAWCRVYAEITQDTTFYTSNELEVKMWSFFCAEASGVAKQSFKIPFENVKKSKLQLPYLPEDIKYSGCVAIKKNGGLYTPCCGKVKPAEEGDEEENLCVTCKKAEVRIGTIDYRAELVEDGTIKPITYGDWMKAHKLTLSEVYSKLAEHGVSVVIPDNEQAVSKTAKARRGRPGKSDDSVVDEDGEPETKVVKAKKEKEVKTKKAKKEKEEVEEVEDVEVKEVKVKKAKKAKEEVEEVDVEVKVKKAKKAVTETEAVLEPVKTKKDKKAKEGEPKLPKSDEEKEAKKARKAAKKAKASSDDLIESMSGLMGELNFEEGETEKNIVDIDGKDYECKNGFILDMDGTIVGKEEDGDVVWTDGR